MKLSLTSIFLLFVVIWNIALSDYFSINHSQTNFREEASIYNSEGFHQIIYDSNKEFHIDFLSEEKAENKEEVNENLVFIILSNIFLFNCDKNIGEELLVIINNNLPPIKRLFIKFQAIKIPNL